MNEHNILTKFFKCKKKKSKKYIQIKRKKNGQEGYIHRRQQKMWYKTREKKRKKMRKNCRSLNAKQIMKKKRRKNVDKTNQTR